MINPKPPKAARSPVTDKIFAALLKELRADSEIDAGLCDRLEAALAPGKNINAGNLREALYPTPKVGP